MGLKIATNRVRVLHSFRVYLSIFSTRFECSFASSPLVSSVSVFSDNSSKSFYGINNVIVTAETLVNEIDENSSFINSVDLLHSF